ncbi:hypothetical protein M885DRAFT_506923 [Pelagophyceae sp. CCMP2097]|nr:hypothetical protein M885DRAFT_506923 [Pelagophyceae sp. CCMP2097]
MASPAKRRRPSCIPGLVLRGFAKGTRHDAATPELVDLRVTDDGLVLAEWRATGSAVYKVTAAGAVRVVLKADGAPSWRGLVVRCSCPDGQRHAASVDEAIVVCKHGDAALRSVMDPDGEAAVSRLVDAAAREAAEARLRQERELPGERARVEHALKHLSAAQLVDVISRRIQTFEGLEHAANLFADLPPPRALTCLRCKEEYDPALCQGKPCKVLHPSSETEWETSKKSWEVCRRCDATFDLNGIHSWAKNAIQDDGPYCFEGDHTTDPDLVEEEDWDAEYDD